jgi:hypothetical protein
MVRASAVAHVLKAGRELATTPATRYNRGITDGVLPLATERQATMPLLTTRRCGSS